MNDLLRKEGILETHNNRIILMHDHRTIVLPVCAVSLAAAGGHALPLEQRELNGPACAAAQMKL